MFGDDPAVEPVDHWVTLFVGDLDQSALEAYLREPGGAADEAPISAFSADLDRWYDHDFLWGMASEQAVTVAELCERLGLDSVSLTQEIAARAGTTVHCLLLLWNARVTPTATQRVFAGGRVRCLGSVAHPSPLTDPEY